MKSTKTTLVDGTIAYMNEHNQLHREDGPAVIWYNGNEEWWIKGKHYSYKNWKYLLSISYKWKEHCEQ